MVKPIAGGGVQPYHVGAKCPNCTGSQWVVGASTAECGRCGHVLLVVGGLRSSTIMARRAGGAWRPGRYELCDTRQTPPASAVIMSRKGSGEWRRAL